MSSPNSRPEEDLILRSQLPLSRPYIEPRTVTEQKLAAIWTSALSMDRVGVEDSYNELGVDSFLAEVIFTQIEEAFGVHMPMAVLVSESTVALLAAAIDRAVKNGAPT
jgi:acyl carrier protein